MVGRFPTSSIYNSRIISDIKTMNKLQMKEVLSRELKNRNISLQTLSDKIGIPKSTLHDWVQGRYPNSKNIHYLKNLSEYLGIPLMTLLFNVKDGPKETLDEILFSSTFKDGKNTYKLSITKEKKSKE